MDEAGFDALTRHIGGIPRRLALGGMLMVAAALPWLAASESATAKKKKKKKKAPVLLPPACVPEPESTTCAPGCGTRTNNCGQTVTCSCFSGQTCLPNGTCGTPCTSSNQCPGTCVCGATIEGGQYCVAPTPYPFVCSQIPGTCFSSAVCARGQQCRTIGCGPVPIPANKCVPLCAG